MGADGDEEELRVDLRDRGVEHPDAQIEEAHELGILLSRSQLEEAKRFYDPWTWGPIARTLMFGYQTDSFARPDRSEMGKERMWQGVKASLLPDVEGPLSALPNSPPDPLNSLLRRRRSRRTFGSEPIEMGSLAACLRAGFGITGERVVDGRRLPLTAAPSSGALNTYDAWVLSRAVQDLDTGTYRYLPHKNHLVRQEGRAVAFDRLFGGQAWAAQASCAVVLIADLRRQASKYSFPTTVSAVLIEAGARAELLLLQAEALSLSAVVVGLAGVGAFDRQLASAAGIWGENSMIVPVCAVLLGVPMRP
jgi:SagB-type dehydrogenase family enzyme